MISTVEKSPTIGSYHWNLERVLSIATLPLLGTAAVYGSIPTVDTLLGIVIPLHCYLGVDCMIQDYIPARRAKVLHFLSSWTLKIATGLVLYGCYVINTSDVGLTAVVKRLWTGKL
jgi:succinate dehydrogenase (ubiquinone) membrane anchor subunit